MIIRVDDVDDQRLDPFRWRERQLASRPQRLERVGAGMFVAEGDLVVMRALDNAHDPVALLCDEEHVEHLSARVDDSIPVYVGSDPLRREVTGLGVPLSMVGLFTRPALISPDDLAGRARHLVVLESIDNPTNVGAIVRSALALGWDGVLLDASSADPLARRALRVSMGAGLVLPFARVAPNQSIEEYIARIPHTVYALTPSNDAVDVAEIETPHDNVALALGAERTGLSDSLMRAAARRVRIPMHAGTDSLNVGAAAAIALHVLGPNGTRR